MERTEKTLKVIFGSNCNCKVCTKMPNGKYFKFTAIEYKKECDNIIITNI